MIRMSRSRDEFAECADPQRGSGSVRGLRRSPALWWRGAQVGLLAVALVFSVASGSKGDRAEEGHCPEGEVCSPDTPSGLYFKGPGFADGFLDNDVHPTAVGGRQSINLDPVGFGEHLGTYDAESTDAAFSIAGISGDNVTVQAEMDGSGYLRIFEPITGALFDRLTISAREVDSIELAPMVYESEFSDDSGDPLYWGGDALPWIARLYHGSTRLVDQTLVYGGDGTVGATAATTGQWDIVEVTPAPGTSSVTMAAESGSGVIGLGEVEVTHTVDTIGEDPDEPVPTTHDASDLFSVCFAAYSGARRILGVPWEFTLSGPDGDEEVGINPFAHNCTYTTLPEPGLWHLQVTAGDITETYDIEVLPPQPAPPPPLPTTSTPQQTPGTPGFRALKMYSTTP